MHNPEQITYFADTDARNRKVRFGIKAKDRTRHVYIIGKTGMGKSTVLENMAAQDVRNQNGFAFIDPHGSAIDTIMRYIPKDRVDDVLLFAPFDLENPISFNVMEDVGYDKRHLVVSGLMSTFKKIWVDAWSARMEYILGNTLLALLEYPNTTLLDVNKMLSDKTFRNKVVNYIKDPSVKTFWVEEFARYTERMAAEATPAIQNKIGQFTANPLIRNIIGQPKSSFDLRQLMDERKIILVNLSKGRVGESNANLLGSMLITKIYLSAMSRSDTGKEKIENLPNFYLYVDEFQSFANESFADILSEARKYKLNLTIAHQYIEQMSDEVRAAVFGNVGTMITFRVGAYDAEVLEKEFKPTFEAKDIVNLGAFQIYLRLMIDGISSQPFSARTMPPLEVPKEDMIQKVIEASRKKYANSRSEVEREMEERSKDNSTTEQNGGQSGQGAQGGGGDQKHGGSQQGGGQQGGGKNKSGGNQNHGGGQQGGGQNGGGESKPKPKAKKPVKVIDKKAQKEIEEYLKNKEKEQKNQSDQKDESSSSESDLEEISLKDLASKTQNGKAHDKKSPSKKNSASLKEALLSVGILDKDSDSDSGADKNSDSKEKPQQKQQKQQKKQKSENQSNNEQQSEQKKEESKKTPPNEVPEKELREILEG